MAAWLRGTRFVCASAALGTWFVVIKTVGLLCELGHHAFDLLLHLLLRFLSPSPSISSLSPVPSSLSASLLFSFSFAFFAFSCASSPTSTSCLSPARDPRRGDDHALRSQARRSVSKRSAVSTDMLTLEYAVNGLKAETNLCSRACGKWTGSSCNERQTAFV